MSEHRTSQDLLATRSVEWTGAEGPDVDHLIVEHAPDVLFVVDTGGRVLRVSPAVTSFAGVDPEELLGHELTAFVRPSEREVAVDALQRLLRGEPAVFEGRIDETRGRPAWISVNAVPVLGPDGSVVCGVGVARDVTRQKDAEAALAASEERFRQLAEHAADTVLVGGPDRVIQWVSDSVVTLLGFSPDEIVGHTRDEFLHPEDVQSLSAIRSALFDASSPVVPGGTQVARLRMKDGGYRWMRAKSSILLDAHGRLSEVITGLNDVDELVRAQAESQRMEAVLRATLDSLIDPHVVLRAVRDDDDRIVDFVYVDANQAACDYNGTSRDELIGRTVRSNRPEDTEFDDQLVELFAGVVESGTPLAVDDFEFAARTSAADGRVFDLRAAKLGDGVVNTWREVTDRHLMEQQLEELASHDPLTGLANRRTMLDELNRALWSAERSGRATAVLMLDIDRFKHVNDALGHAVGDALLVLASRRLDGAVRAGDLVARLGGDEFVVVMRDLESPAEAVAVGERIVADFRQHWDVGGSHIEATASIGIALSVPGSDAESLLHDADTAMYRAKQHGRSQVWLFSEQLRNRSKARTELEAQLRPAMELGQLVMHYQPEVLLRTGTVRGAEALLRWQHPNGSLVAADEFIGVAEETGLIADIGLWAVRQVCTEMATWTGAPAAAIDVLALNLSRAQLADPTLVAGVEQVLGDTGLRADRLALELPEPALLPTTPTVTANLTALRELGVHLTLDNFGRGGAAMSLLREFSIDSINIDHSVIRDLERHDHTRRFVSGVVAFARSLGVTTCCLGVETATVADLVAELGCDTARGFFFGGAVPADELAAGLGRPHRNDR